MEMVKRRWLSTSTSTSTSNVEQFSLPTYDDCRPIETHEQEEIIRSFEKKHERQNSLWRGVFAVLLLSFAMFYIFSLFQQALYPWELRYHAYFMDEVGSWIIILADMSAVVACLMAVKGLLKSDSHRHWIWHPCLVGLGISTFWFYHMLSSAGICFYVDRLLEESLEEVKKLRAAMYSYKRTY
ncbi:uncharacterized protein LOC105421372 isoform X2 [Amborella trichopoda]|uniref:uncharacterized protein LOC105421372 isoform X2 n=1 Tax=Amborella trichopoda TaxID=13333 RepID=UPI0009BFEFF6|nr:uncharacterized protein LOC105421372 isoform X2 [Amborella trichopoda]|eukprot:XP_020528814.1 uncharacterized protein LOC105421372 isoform X2 [Amborella trichopoda]